MKLKIENKARNLYNLKNIIKYADIAPLVFFSFDDWKNRKNFFLNKILNSFKAPYIVRSSFLQEDKKNYSNAGKYLSILNINKNNIEKSINTVFQENKKINLRDEVLIQPMIKDVIMSGVAFSHDPNLGSPYRLINWTNGENTTLVTSGKKSNLWQYFPNNKYNIPKKFKKIINLINELLNVFNNIPLDIEFAITKKNNKEKIWLLQVRPLIIKNTKQNFNNVYNKLHSIENQISIGMRSHPFLLGKTTIYGVMADWNPAEIIGIKPKPLALSLYKNLITDSIWAYQRHNYGYRNLRSFPLLIDFYGLPYIDLRISFNSFIPSTLSENIGEKLVNYYLELLKNKPSLHDKIEFEIVFSCFAFDTKNKLKNLPANIFSTKEKNLLLKSLLVLTNNIINIKNGLWVKDANKIKTLNRRREKILKSNTNDIEKIFWLLEDLKRYGTLPFAGLARAAFVSISLLKSLVKINILSNEDYDNFLNSLSTISSSIKKDKNILTKKEFILKYGHLRPGTYDIEYPRYIDDPKKYFKWNNQKINNNNVKKFKLTELQLNKINQLIHFYKLKTNALDLFKFMKLSIELRESSKFYFTKNLSEAIEIIGKYGKKYNISKKQLAYTEISIYDKKLLSSYNPEKILSENIKENKKKFEDLSRINLPYLITKPRNVWDFKSPKISPNFITNKRVVSTISDINNVKNIKNSIVCIPSADPGFDWIFSYNILGLITEWGGANSHMAIRAGELGLPAVIGAGSALFNKWSKSNTILIDCALKKVKIID